MNRWSLDRTIGKTTSISQACRLRALVLRRADVQSGYWFLNDNKPFKPPTGLLDFIEKAHADGKPVVYIGFGSITVRASFQWHLRLYP